MNQAAVRIDGTPVTAPRSMQVRSPYHGRLLAEVPAMGRTEIERAVAAAARGLARDHLATWQRAEILDRAAEVLTEADVAEQLAATITEESAKPISIARAEVARAASTFRFAAAACRTVTGEVLPLDASAAGERRLGFTLRVPVGVVGAITPFNFPVNLVVHKLAPAIAAGCPVVLKPAHQTPLSAIAVSELLLDRCGLPASWLHVVTGEGAEAGAELVAHPDVAMITFTGSPQVGWGIRAAAPRKRVSLELGNNSPVIIEPDGDWQRAADLIAIAGFAHAGQSCISVQRVLVHAAIATAFNEALVAAVQRLVVGDPTDPTTQVSSLIDIAARDRVAAWIREATDGGAKLATGGEIDSDGVLLPTVLTDVEPDMRVCRDEVFGPVVGVASYETLDEAFARANDTRYGLHAGIFTNDLDVAARAIRTLDFGGVLINEVPTWRADQMPYGGLRDSGNTREGPAYSLREMTETRSVILA